MTQAARYERIAGEPVAMSPKRIEHAQIKSRVWAALARDILRAGQDCEALADGVTIEVDDGTDDEPDAVVNRGPKLPADATAASIDSSDKLADYFRVPSIQHYPIVRAKRRDIIHHSRAGSDIVARLIDIGTIVLNPPGIVIDLANVYGRQA